MNVIKYLWNLTKKNKLQLSIFFIINIFVWMINIFIYSLMGNYIDLLINESSIKNVYYFSVYILTLTLIFLVVGYINNMLQIKLTTRIAYNINFKLADTLKKAIFDEISSMDPNYLSQKIYSDSSTIATFFITNITSIIIQILNVITILILIFKIDAKMALVILLFIPVYVITYIKFKAPLYEKGFTLKEKQSDFFSKFIQQEQN